MQNPSTKRQKIFQRTVKSSPKTIPKIRKRRSRQLQLTLKENGHVIVHKVINKI